ncbi:hypothetical protein PINS_up011013 [Pythium insidiosum]|nr:hypothetical protein PINS_up011013 [Pythium insidiosum]
MASDSLTPLPLSTSTEVGQRCEILSTGTGLRASLKRYGVIAFVGSVEGLPAGEWVGVRLDKPLGKNDGTYQGKRYFDAQPLHGAFVRRDKIALQDADSIDSFSRRRPLEDKTKAVASSHQEPSGDALVQAFWSKFTDAEDRIRRQVHLFIEQRKQPMLGDSADEIKLDSVVAAIHALREDAATAASLYLSRYDIRQTQLIVAKLLELIETTRTAFAPRKKFTFKARARRELSSPASSLGCENADDSNGSKGNNNEPERATTAKDDAKKSNLFVNPDELVFANRKNETIVIDASTWGNDAASQDSRRRDLSFSQLENCVVIVLVETSAIRGDALKRCVFYTGPIWGSLWLENSVDSAFFVACRQLRVHHSSGTAFHLRIASHPIIEDCHTLEFGAYHLRYAGLVEQLERCGLQRDNGLWAKVNDFKWHKAQQSPNWRLRDPKKPLQPVSPELQHLLQIE